MSSALIATTKSFCKRAWPSASISVAALVIVPLMINILMRLQGLTIPYSDQEIFSLHFTYLGISWIIFLTITVRALAGSQNYCRGLPISSRAIATWLMLAMVGLVVVLQLATNGAYRALFFDERWLSDYWPVLGPVLFLVTLVLTGHAIFWTLNAPSYTRLLLSMGIIVALFWWFLSRYFPQGFKTEAVPWSQVTLGEFVLMQLVSLAAWYQGTRAFASVRSGTAVPSPAWERMRGWWNSLLTGAISEQSAVSLSSQQSSLARLHWRESCQQSVIVGGGLFGLLALIFNLMIGTRLNSEPAVLRDVMEGFVAFATLCSLISAVIIATILGLGICNTGRTEMKRYLAMAPLSDPDFSATLFTNMLKSLGWSILIIQSALVLSLAVTAVLYGVDTLSVLQVAGFLGNASNRVSVLLVSLFGGNGFLCHTLVILIGFWVIAANMVSVLWTGRTWFIGSAVGVCFGGLFFYSFTLSLLESFFPRQFLAELVIVSILLLLYFLILGCTLAAYVAASRRQLITKYKFRMALLLWGIVVMGVLVILLTPPQYYPIQTVCVEFCVFSALFALAFAPFATIPLALSWNRHR